MLAFRFSLADLFDRAGRLRPFAELPAKGSGEAASFDVVRTTIRREGETVTTEELIRLKVRDGRKAEIARRGGTTIRAKLLRSKPLKRGIVTTRERSAGSGRTAAQGHDLNTLNNCSNGEAVTDDKRSV